MDPFTMVVLIVLIVVGSRIFTQRGRQQPSEPDESLLAELDDLRHRVAVLEEIVTDEQYHLKRELNALERQQ